jgi:hypothetical protein
LTALAESEGFAVPAPDDDAVVRERDAGLDEWLDDRQRAEAAADPDRVSYRDDLAGFIAAYRKFYGLADDETDPTPPGGPAPAVAA